MVLLGCCSSGVLLCVLSGGGWVFGSCFGVLVFWCFVGVCCATQLVQCCLFGTCSEWLFVFIVGNWLLWVITVG